MKITKIANCYNFGLKFSENSEKLFQKSQDYIADKSIIDKDNDIVIKNNLNRMQLEFLFNDTFILDSKFFGKNDNEEQYAFMLTNNVAEPQKSYFLCFSKISDILNGNVWSKLIKILNDKNRS